MPLKPSYFTLLMRNISLVRQTAKRPRLDRWIVERERMTLPFINEHYNRLIAQGVSHRKAVRRLQPLYKSLIYRRVTWSPKLLEFMWSTTAADSNVYKNFMFDMIFGRGVREVY